MPPNVTVNHSGNNSVDRVKDLTFYINVAYGFTPALFLIFIFGTAGNIATILTLRRKNLRNTSTSIYLMAFAAADCFYIFLAVLSKIVQDFTIFPNELRDLNDVWCRMHMFAVYTATYISIWLLVAVSVDRAIQVVIPFRARELSTPRNAKITISAICLIFVILNTQQLVTFRLSVNLEGVKKCSTNNTFNTLVLPWTDLIISAFLPFFLMMISSICIMIKLRIIRNVRRKAQAKNANLRRNRRESASVTTMLLATNIFFITSVSPYLVYNILHKIDYITKEIKEETRATGKSSIDTFAYRKYYIIKSLSVLLWNLNFSIHFLLYCFSGKRFRREALALFSCKEDTAHCVNGCQTAAETEFTLKNKADKHLQNHQLGGGGPKISSLSNKLECTRLIEINTSQQQQ